MVPARRQRVYLLMSQAPNAKRGRGRPPLAPGTPRAAAGGLPQKTFRLSRDLLQDYDNAGGSTWARQVIERELRTMTIEATPQWIEGSGICAGDEDKATLEAIATDLENWLDESDSAEWQGGKRYKSRNPKELEDWMESLNRREVPGVEVARV